MNIQAPGAGWVDKTKTATLYMQTPHTKLHTVLKQRVAWYRQPGLCPRSHHRLHDGNHIVDKGILGLWCEECEDE